MASENHKKKGMRGIEVLSARVNADVYRQVQILSKRKDLTITQIVRASIREYIARNNES
jgi:predicted transcriptional regulator